MRRRLAVYASRDEAHEKYAARSSPWYSILSLSSGNVERVIVAYPHYGEVRSAPRDENAKSGLYVPFA